MILVSDQEHEERRRTGTTCFFSRELCTYPGGYVDGKYTSRAFLREVEARGSEPARFAFQDARILFTRDDRLSELITRVARYPVADKASRIWRFQAQFEAWNWYAGEALKRQNLHLLRVAVAKLTLFGGRLVLAHNELLYPYHKWFLRVLENAPDKPPGLLGQIDVLTRAPTAASIEAFATSIRRFRPWENQSRHVARAVHGRQRAELVSSARADRRHLTSAGAHCGPVLPSAGPAPERCQDRALRAGSRSPDETLLLRPTTASYSASVATHAPAR